MQPTQFNRLSLNKAARTDETNMIFQQKTLPPQNEAAILCWPIYNYGNLRL